MGRERYRRVVPCGNRGKPHWNISAPTHCRRTLSTTNGRTVWPDVFSTNCSRVIKLTWAFQQCRPPLLHQGSWRSACAIGEQRFDDFFIWLRPSNAVVVDLVLNVAAQAYLAVP